MQRLSVLMIVCCVALLITYWVRGSNADYGLFQLLRGEFAPVPAEVPVGETTGTEAEQQAFVPPSSKPPVDLEDVPILALVSREKSKLAAAIGPAVVSIQTEKEERIDLAVTSPLYENDVMGIEPGHGSGVLVDPEGYVVTNLHVVDGAKEITVTTADQRRYPAFILDSDRVVDVAVLKLEVGLDMRFPYLPFGDSAKVRQGDMVFSVGSPFGLDGTFTDGVISSAAPRRISDSTPPLLQTNTILNQGNSGGPLVNVIGEIIGINTAVYNGAENFSESGTAYGLAIPSNIVRSVWLRIRNHQERPSYGYLGVYLKDVYPHEAIGLRLRSTDGCLVNGTLAGSPAYHAGLKKDDVIIEFEGNRFDGIKELVHRIQRSEIGSKVALKVVRDGAEQIISAVIRHPGSVEIPQPKPLLIHEIWKRTGLRVDYVAASERLRKCAPSQPMVEISEIRQDSVAESKGLHPGLLIHWVDQVPTQTPKEFYELLNQRQGESSVMLTISAPGRRGYVPLQIPLG